MANYLSNETTDFAKSDFAGNAGQQPIMLARLPQVGGPQPLLARPAVDPAVPAPEEVPQLSLRTEIDQRTRLQIAATPGEGHASSTARFVDRQHVPQHAPQAEPLLATESEEPPPSQTTVRQPASLGESLFQLQSGLAPHAGLIVALALIASAGLLYWMIVGPTNAPDPSYPIPGYEYQPEGFGATSNYQPEALRSEFTVDFPTTTQPTTAPSEWLQLTFPDPPQQVAIPEMSALPKRPIADPPPLKIATPAPSATTPPIELQYPATSHPYDLDFTALHDNSPTAVLQPLPEVAQRRSAPTHR